MKNIATYVDIREKLIKILQEKIFLDTNKISEDNYSKNLLGSRLGLSPRDLLCTFFFIEEEFGIEIPEEAVLKDKFNNINDIAEIIYGNLNEDIVRTDD